MTDIRYKRKQQKRRKQRRILFVTMAVVLLVLILLEVGITIHKFNNYVYKEQIFEAGEEILASAFQKDSHAEVTFTEDSPSIDTSVPGEYEVNLKVGNVKFKCKAIVKDTTAPTAEPKNAYFLEGETVKPEDFVKNIVDATKVQITFVTTPDYTKFGRQEVEVRLTDTSGNTSTVTSYLSLRKTVEKLTMEAGSAFPKVKEFLLSTSDKGSFVEDETSAQDKDKLMSTVGEYEIAIKIGEEEYYSILEIVDTVPPQVTVEDITVSNKSEVSCEDFVKKLTDKTEVSYKFIIKPDVSKLGTQTITFIATDEGGNQVTLEAKMKVIEDKTAPVIKGAKDITVMLGQTISYKAGIIVTDDCDRNLSLKVDTSKVDTTKCGTYPVIYSATDASGNKTSITIQVTIKDMDESEAEAYRMAEEVLATILKDGMTELEKLKAIYKWTRGSIYYSGSSDKATWSKAAISGFKDRKGDCYTYFAVSKALLTVAGIENRDIEKIPAKTHHYWNLVNIGDGWYHFDATPRKGQTISFCYISDADLMAYSNANNLSHNYDRTIYTDIQ